MINEGFRKMMARYYPGFIDKENELAEAGKLRYPVGTIVHTDWTGVWGGNPPQRIRERLTVEFPTAKDDMFVTCCFFHQGNKHVTTRDAAKVTLAEESTCAGCGVAITYDPGWDTWKSQDSNDRCGPANPMYRYDELNPFHQPA